MRFKDLKIRMKLIGTYVLTSIFMFALASLTYFSAMRTDHLIGEVTAVRLPSSNTAADMVMAQTTLLLAERTLIHSTTGAEIDFQKERMAEAMKDYQAARDIFTPLDHSPKEIELWNQYQPIWDQFLSEHNKVVTMYLSGNPAQKAQASGISLTKVRELDAKARTLMLEIHEISAKLGTDAGAIAKKEAVFSAVVSVVAVVVSVLLVFLGIILSKLITDPLRKGVAFAQMLEKGDLTAQVEVDQKDEFGLLADALNRMANNFRSIVRDLTNNAEVLSTSASDLSTVSEQLTGSAQEMSEKTNSVAAATEEMSVSFSSVSAAASQSSANAGAVASATEEMTASVSEIAQNTDKARRVTSEVVTSVNSTSNQMNELGAAANEISQVIEVIVEIAEQTKLLALNATIEAARAGEAGKGFAVVASEVKELAKQTNDATEDIRHKIEAMQRTAERSIQNIAGINHEIHSVEEIIQSIATAVEEQSISTREIAANIGQAAQGIQSVTTGVLQTTGVVADVAKDVMVVDDASRGIKSASEQVNSSAQELSRMGTTLHGIVQRFRV